MIKLRSVLSLLVFLQVRHTILLHPTDSQKCGRKSGHCRQPCPSCFTSTRQPCPSCYTKIRQQRQEAGSCCRVHINSNLEQRVAAALVSNLTLRSSVTQTAAWWDESEELAHARIEDSLEHQVEQKLSAASPGGAEESPGRP